MAVTYPVLVDGRQPPQISVDWSPDGESVLFSYEGAVLLVDAQTGQTRKIADGGAALWSPTGEWISYVTSQSEPALLNVATGASKIINPGKPTGSVLEWSPDGKYLLIPEGEGSHVPYGCPVGVSRLRWCVCSNSALRNDEPNAALDTASGSI
jgi:Tol biopolymer transport system component